MRTTLLDSLSHTNVELAHPRPSIRRPSSPSRYLIESATPINHVQSTDRAHFNNLYTQATVLYQTKRYSETIAYAQKALAILPQDPRPYAIIGLAMAYMKNPEASEWAKKAITKDPTNGLYHGCLADTYTIRGKWKEGLEPMREAVSLSPENPSLQSGLGLCLLRTKKFREAVPYLQRAVEL